LTIKESTIAMSGMRVLKAATFQIVIFSVSVTVLEARPFIYGCPSEPFVTAATHIITTMIRFEGFLTNYFVHRFRLLFAFITGVAVATYSTHTRPVLRCSLIAPSPISVIIGKTFHAGRSFFVVVINIIFLL